jgi:hypothetical protein
MSLLANTTEAIKSITRDEAFAGYDAGKWDIHGVVKATGKRSLVIAAALNRTIFDNVDFRFDLSRAIEGQVDVVGTDGSVIASIDADGNFSSRD